MYQLLIFASLALVAQAQSLAPAPEVTTAPTLNAAQIQQHLLMGWALPEPGIGPRGTRAAPTQPESTTAPPVLSAEQIQQHLLMGWALPEPGQAGGSRLVRAAPPVLNPAQIQQHALMGWALPEPGAGPRPIRAAPRAPPAHNAHGSRSPLLQGHHGIRGPAIRAPLY